MAPAIEAAGLTRTFGEFRAVDAIDLSVREGELFSLLGPNGAGKTTAIKMLCCLLRPSAGTATVMGHDIVGDPIGVKSLIALSPQETAIAEHLDAWENLLLMAGLHGLGGSKARQRAGDLLDMMGLVDRGNDKTKHYSGGMKRRLSLAMALVSEPAVLFLDEPTLGLDPQSRRAIWEHIADLKGRATIVLTTHYLEEADALADRVEIIDDGRIVALGTPAELKESISDGAVTIVELDHITSEALGALRERFEQVSRTDRGIEIAAESVDLYDIEDILRPRGVAVKSTYQKQVTLDDVFLELTGKQMRE